MDTEEYNKKKILYIITKSNLGGAQRYVYDLATSLCDAGYDVAVAMGGDGALAEELEKKSVRVINIEKLGRDVAAFNDAAVFFSLIKLFIREKPDIVHLNSSKAGGLGAVAGRVYNLIARLSPKHRALSPARIIFTAHGWAFNESWRNPVMRGVIWLLSFITSVFSHHIITVSLKDYKQGKTMPFIGGKISHIYTGIDKERFSSKQKAREKILGDGLKKIPKDAYWLGTIAELTANKGIEYAINSIYRITLDKGSTNPFVYIVIGDGENKYKLYNLIRHLGLEDKVFLAGSKNKASSFLKAFDTFVLPSLKEGFPYTLLEAGLAGLPTIATNVGGIPEIITDMDTGILVRPRDVGELSKTIFYLSKHKEKRRMLGEHLKEKVESAFSLKKMINETVCVYNK